MFYCLLFGIVWIFFSHFLPFSFFSSKVTQIWEIQTPLKQCLPITRTLMSTELVINVIHSFRKCQFHFSYNRKSWKEQGNTPRVFLLAPLTQFPSGCSTLGVLLHLFIKCLIRLEMAQAMSCLHHTWHATHSRPLPCHVPASATPAATWLNRLICDFQAASCLCFFLKQDHDMGASQGRERKPERGRDRRKGGRKKGRKDGQKKGREGGRSSDSCSCV